MADKRMFSKKVIESDDFCDLPLTTQALYLHLSINADDDGFVNAPKKIQRGIGANAVDMELLINSGYVIPFESGIMAITHWRLHNYIAKDRYKPTIYMSEMQEIDILSDKTYAKKTVDNSYTECIQTVDSTYTERIQVVDNPYTECTQTVDNEKKSETSSEKNPENKPKNDMYTNRIQSVYNPYTDCVHRLDKSRLDKDRVVESRVEKESTTPYPTQEDVINYIKENDMTIDGNKFFDYYSGRGWMSNGTKITDWQAIARNWQRNERKKPVPVQNDLDDVF